MPDMYAYEFRHDINLLDICWHSALAPALVRDYARELKDCFVAEGFAPGYLLRMDMSAAAAQTRDALPVFEEAFRDFPKARRIAVITPRAITRLQVKRVMTQPYLRIFADADEGLAWLLGRTWMAAA